MFQIGEDTCSKKIGFDYYLHISQLDSLPAQSISRILKAKEIAKVSDSDFNVVKCNRKDPRLTFLYYRDFFEEGFPELKEYWTVDYETNKCLYRTYESSINPPILHRKELLLNKTHEHYRIYEKLSKDAEELGLFEKKNQIGFKRFWTALLKSKGYEVSGNSLVPIANCTEENKLNQDIVVSESFENVERHRTALVRYGFSAPVQALAKYGYLDGSKTVFDYGCGRGDDIRGLKDNNITAAGWDPHYAKNSPLIASDIVNLGFVINVIEDKSERDEALSAAFNLCKDMLVVSAMLISSENITGKPYRDGYLTQRGTFQKYYTQQMLKDYIDSTLLIESIPVGPGI